MLCQSSKPDLIALSGMLEKYLRRRVLMFKSLEEIMSNLSPISKEIRELPY